jgi:hypothetical protein
VLQLIRNIVDEDWSLVHENLSAGPYAERAISTSTFGDTVVPACCPSWRALLGVELHVPGAVQPNCPVHGFLRRLPKSEHVGSTRVGLPKSCVV